jgi:hypothetical protein
MHSIYKCIKLKGYVVKYFRRKYKILGEMTFTVNAISPKDADSLVFKYLESVVFKIDTHLEDQFLVSTRITQISNPDC